MVTAIQLEIAVPVTAKLSKQFYDAFGEQVVNELVDWFNQVDTTYKAELRELNELNFARFDAKVEQRFAESDAKLEKRFAAFEINWEKRFTSLERNWETRFIGLEVNWEKRFTGLEVNWEKRFTGLEVSQAEFEGRLVSALERGFKEHTRWMFAVWTEIGRAHV